MKFDLDLLKIQWDLLYDQDPLLAMQICPVVFVQILLSAKHLQNITSLAEVKIIQLPIGNNLRQEVSLQLFFFFF